VLVSGRHVTVPCPGAPDQESEGEEAAEARVALAQDMGRGNLASRHSRVRLQEVCFHLLGHCSSVMQQVWIQALQLLLDHTKWRATL
jgi:hypothetical protein